MTSLKRLCFNIKSGKRCSQSNLTLIFFNAVIFSFRREYEDDVYLSNEEKTKRRTAELCLELNRVLLKHLRSTAPHLLEAEVDIEPRHESFWMAGGIEPPEDKKIWIERKKELTEEEKDEPIDRPFQYVGRFSTRSCLLF